MEVHKHSSKCWRKREVIETIKDGDGNPIDIYRRTNIQRTSIRKVCRDDNISEEDAYKKYFFKIFSDTNAQSSIRTRVIDSVGSIKSDEILEVEYVPRSGKNKGDKVVHTYISNTVRRVIWLSEVAEEKNNKIIKKEKLGTYWENFDYNNVGKEGGVPFPNGKKPIQLIQTCIQLIKDTSGIILDFFSGSASTAHAVMSQNIADGGNRKFIMVQLPEHIDPENNITRRSFLTSARQTSWHLV